LSQCLFDADSVKTREFGNQVDDDQVCLFLE
jgi:hypothetical protein